MGLIPGILDIQSLGSFEYSCPRVIRLTFVKNIYKPAWRVFAS